MSLPLLKSIIATCLVWGVLVLPTLFTACGMLNS